MKAVKKAIKEILGWVNLMHPKKGVNQKAVKYSDGTAKFSDDTVVRTNQKAKSN